MLHHLTNHKIVKSNCERLLTPTNTTNVNNSTQDVKLSSHLKLKSKNIELSQLVKKEMSQVAEEYFKRTGKDLVITDGNRTARDQAERIYDKIIVHEENIYTNKAALAEVKTAYNHRANALKVEHLEQIVFAPTGFLAFGFDSS